MNSEELEQSLRTEFEIYLKDVLADMKQETADLQQKVQDEFEKHKAQLDEVFQDFSSRTQKDLGLNASFKDSIVEHLRLSRDEGARITATAIAEAEAMQQEHESQMVEAAPPIADYSDLRDAIQDISEKDSQSAILKALVTHAGQYTPRGAFFILKNEHFVGWRVFGKDGETDEQTVREVFFPVSSDTVLGESVRSLSAVESGAGTYTEDSLFLNKLDFGQPEKMFAVPLVARNRGVAVLYADQGTENEKVNIEALETLVRVAGMTVELLAASQGVKPRQEEPAVNSDESEATVTPKSEDEDFEHSTKEHSFAAAENAVEDFSPVSHKTVSEEPELKTAEDEYDFRSVPAETNFNYSDQQPKFEQTGDFEAAEEKDYFGKSYADNKVQDLPSNKTEEPASEYSWSQPLDASDKFEEVAETPEQTVEETTRKDFAFDSPAALKEETGDAIPPPDVSDFEFTNNHQPYDFSTENVSNSPVVTEVESPQFETNYQSWDAGKTEEPKFETPNFEPANDFAANTFESNFETFPAAPVETKTENDSAAMPKSRLSERNVDLPIEVPEEERRSHNDARRFARLLVSEIKLYNEQKVKEGREMNDLYERLREAIDRSREMYDKRVQSPVASKFDYFHYELVNNLAEGSETKLGAGYPGAMN